LTSLRRQLWRSGVLVVLLLSLVLWGAGRWAMHDGVATLIGSRLQHDAETLVSALDWSTGRLVFDEHVLAGPYLQPRSGHYYVVRVDERRFQSRSLWDEDLPLHPLRSGEMETAVVPGPGGRPVLLRQAAYRKQGHMIWTVVAEDIEPMEEAMERLDLVFVVITLLAALVLLLLQRWHIRRALRPLAGVRQQLDELAEGGREYIDQPVPEEIQPLIDTLNRMVRSLHQRLRRSRNGLGDMAHALKTPLNVLMQDITSVEEDALRERLKGQASRIGEIVERELRRARIAGSGPTGEQWQPVPDLQDLVEVLGRIHEQVTIELLVPDTLHELALDREDMLELVGNLLDNACKWAASRAVLRLSIEQGTFVLVIEDDGPGVPGPQRERLLERGRRLDERVEGHGLGLSIVREIVDSYDGQLELDDSELGGLRVVVRLPF